MIIVKKEESREPCVEAGWYAYDYVLEREMQREEIMKLREMEGSFLYLEKLKQPFFKLENRYYILKGVEGKNTFRLSMYKDYEEEICRKVELLLSSF